MGRFIDLSHPISSGMRTYPGLPSPRVEPHISHAASRASYGGSAEFEISRVFMVGSTGTYLDSPYHRYGHGSDIGDLSITSLAGLPGVVLDPGDRATAGAVDVAVPGDTHGHAVLIRTGWSRRWGRSAYWRPGPFLGPVLVDALIASGVALVGVDFWNIDDTADLARPAHSRLLAAGILVVEHLTGLEHLPASGFRFSAVPPPIHGAASFPVRAFAEVPDGGI